MNPWLKRGLYAVLLLIALFAVYLWAVLSWSFSTGERAGWVQKLSHKGWICKTWEGELAMVSMPGAMPEKFYFTVRSDEVAQQINRVMGKRVSVHYEEKVGLPTSCFGDTPYFVTGVTAAEEIPLAPGVMVPAAPLTSAAPASSAPGAQGAAGAPALLPPPQPQVPASAAPLAR